MFTSEQTTKLCCVGFIVGTVGTPFESGCRLKASSGGMAGGKSIKIDPDLGETHGTRL
jgi:hypothetical protein